MITKKYLTNYYTINNNIIFLQSGDLLSGDSLCDNDKECDILLSIFYDNDSSNSNDDTLFSANLIR